MSGSQGLEHPNASYGLQIGSQVDVIGEQGSYLVVHIDRQRYTVDVIPMQGGAAVRGVHLSAVALPTDRPTAMRVRTLLERYSGE